MKTILITGASSGIGKATAIYFEKQGWNVIATMRNPEKECDLRDSTTLKKYRLDVCDAMSITQAVNEGIEAFGCIDVLLNNAGYGAYGALETTSEEKMQHQFDVNVFGIIRMIKAILPHFREKKSGRIINVSSMGGRITLPFGSLYHATKFAIEGLSETLNYELNPLGIDIKLVEPGAVRTDFYGRSMDFSPCTIDAYKEQTEKLKTLLANATEKQIPSSPNDIAKIIYKAATTKSKRMRYLAGRDAKVLVLLRNFFGVNLFMKIVRKIYKF